MSLSRVPIALTVSLSLLFLLLLPSGSKGHPTAYHPKHPIKVSSVGNTESRQEVFLSFKYRNLVDKVVIAYLENGNYYLPVSEIFTTLKIPHRVNTTDLSLEGFFLDPENNFRFQFQKENFEVTLENKGTFQFEGNQMLIRELDFYVQLDVLTEVFDLNFTVDINNLLLQLQTPHVVPIVEEFERAERRRTQEKLTIQQNYYPLEYDRDRALLGGAFLDYSLSANLNNTNNAYNANLDLGAELLGGDLQGSTFANYSNNFSSFTTNNLRWRYVLRDNPYFTQFFAGQTTSDGLINRNFTGIRLTNEPIEPRFLYDSYEITGRAAQGSEVELYYNNALYDFRRVTEEGQYRFLAPLTYGTSRLRLRVYGPDGRVTEREEHIQVPFSFLPQGEISYHLNAGRLDNAIFGTSQNSNIVQGDIAYGLSNTITQKVGVEYFNEFQDQSPLVYSSTSARLLDNYLLNLDLAPGAFYRFSSNTIYPSSASWGIGYTYYTDRGIYNLLGYDQEISGNVFLPFTISEIPFNIRLIGDYAIAEPQDNLRYNIDLNSRISRLNVRFSYRDRQVRRFTLNPSVSSELSASATYLVSREDAIPRYLQNTFISAKIDYNPGLRSFEEAEVKVSRSIFEKGRIQAAYSRNFIGDFNFLNVGVTIDFDAFRSTSTARNIRSKSFFTQNIRGSIGYDDYNRDLLFTNRQQVGRSATSLRLFVDANNSGNYEEGEQVIEDEAVRIGRAGVSRSYGEGVLRFSQLQPYHRINMEINQAAITNPLLIPSEEQFSIVTDPNQYKPINIPFYVSGIIEGKVIRKTTDGEQPLSGIRLFLEGEDNSHQKTMQTFSDGSFYAYEVPPGIYTLKIDSTQLQFLDVISEPAILNFEVEALAEGDFKENLNFTLLPADGIQPGKETPVAEKEGPQEDEQQQPKIDRYYLIQLASYATLDWAKRADLQAETQFDGTFFIRYNPKAELYAIRTPTFEAREEAIQQMLSYLDSPFNEPALVVTKDTSFTGSDLYPTFTIQLDSLQSRKEAGEVAEELGRKAGLSVNVIIDPSNPGLYKLWMGAFPSRDEAMNYRKNLGPMKNNYLSVINIEKSDIPALDFTYGLDITAVNQEASATYLQELQQSSLIPGTIDLEIEGRRILLRGISTWKAAVTLKGRLDHMLDEATVTFWLKQERID